MALRPFLAFGWAEMRSLEAFPGKTAWLGCRFSPSGEGLSNLPQALPPGSLLILDDSNPIQSHDPELVTAQILAAVKELDCSAVLLDFQRRDQAGAEEMAAALVQALPCPAAVSSLYAKGLDCPVFLPPVPPSIPLKEALWPDRECWLELALDGEIITITEKGARVSPLAESPEEGFREESLHCHYCLELEKNQALWKLWRTREDLDELLREAETLGVTQAVGLYQELAGNKK